MAEVERHSLTLGVLEVVLVSQKLPRSTMSDLRIQGSCVGAAVRDSWSGQKSIREYFPDAYCHFVVTGQYIPHDFVAHSHAWGLGTFA